MEDRAPLRLPDGRRTSLRGDARDLSVFGALVAADGMWEPHVVALFSRIVRPDWVCIDIGANLGAHVLALSSLCTEGTVVAFEAGSVNAAHLAANVAGRPQPSGDVVVERLALWDEPGQLHLAMIDQLAGCSFLSERGPEGDEQLIRTVVSSEQVDATPLDLTSDPVEAVRLDDWVREHSLPRLDLVKIDVEGAETRVLAGAERVLQEHRPVLVTEYNPDCARTYWDQPADAYFELLMDVFDAVAVIEPEGGLSSPLQQWSELEERLSAGRGWEDLCCTWVPPEPARRSGWRSRLSRR